MTDRADASAAARQAVASKYLVLTDRDADVVELTLEAAAPHLEADLAAQLEHAKAALAGDSEGVRLWMLDCGALVEQHRRRADEATTAERERCARLAGEIRRLLTSGPIGQASGERYIRADLIRAVLDEHDAGGEGGGT